MAQPLDERRIAKAWELKRAGKLYKEIAAEIGVSLQQTKRYLNPDWIADRELEDTTFADYDPSNVNRFPIAPVQRETWLRCRKNDHQWMFEEEYDAFEGIIYKSELEAPVVGGAVRITTRRTCAFCGFR